ncbi:MAG: TolC family protein [Saprospiraceae bacterium]|nr:TolC family protein [Saprospiraceae bacterium]MCF8251513.1 TolC family protein [Saprospiraceae bacterium]MCF8280764.1 TolC family protein [Bacteroidales bacterium]MCF8313373.1 TolC family protein [Saprospiraceae bacterium]MCF8441807.1 TolC family protein [Saprospiraceae bacterium]
MKLKIAVAAILLAISANAQTLENYLQIAAENNPGIRAKQTEFQAALQKLPQAKSLPDPTVNAAFFLSPMMLPMGNQLGSISAMQMFPWPGSLDAMENEAARMAEVKLQAVAVAQNELFFKVKSAWYPLFELEEQIRIQRENLRVLETDKELATVKFQQGQAPMVDAIRADIMMDEVKTEIAILEQKRKPLEIAFNQLLARDAASPVTISGSLPEPVVGAAARRDSLVGNNPMLAVFDKQIQVAKAEEKVADFMRKPMIGGGLQYMPLVKRKSHDVHIEPNTGKDMFMPMVSVTVPIWNKKYNAAVEERRLMQVMYADMKQDMQNELAAMYEMSFYEVEKMAQMVELLNLQMAKTQQAIDLMMAAYSNAGQDFDEILRLQQQLFRYRMEKVSAQTEYQLALVKLDYLTGK